MKASYNKTAPEFSRDLRSAVRQYFTQNKIQKTASQGTRVSALLLLLVYLVLAVSLSQQSLKALFFVNYLVLGCLTLPLVLNIGHDAVHNAFFAKRRYNDWAQNIFFLLGTSPYFWRLRHIHSHHAYSNVPGLDMDIDQSEILRLSDQTEHKAHHRWQHFYMPFVFCFYTLNWFLYRDFKDLFSSSFGTQTKVVHPAKEYLKLIVSKVLMLCYLVYLPWQLSDFSLATCLIGFLLFHLAASLVTTFALVSTHVGTQQEFVVAEGGKLPYSYDEHQLRTTSDFATSNRFLTWYYGGFNHHVAHHLFPNVSQSHYPHITPIIIEKCQEYHLPYNATSTLAQSIAHHFKLLKRMSNKH